MASEKALCKWFKGKIEGPGVHYQRLEGTTDVPDINVCVLGVEHWLEAKELDRFPVRPTTPVRLKHNFTLGQCIWLEKRGKAYGNAWGLIQVGREVFLISHYDIRALMNGELTEVAFREAAAATGRIDVIGHILDER